MKKRIALTIFYATFAPLYIFVVVVVGVFWVFGVIFDFILRGQKED